MNQKTVWKNSSLYLLASILPVAANFVMLPVYTRFIAAEDFAVWVLFQSLVLPITILLTGQLHSSLGRLYFDHSEASELRTYLSSIFFTCLGIGVTVTGLMVFFYEDLFQLLFDKIPEAFSESFRLILLTPLFYFMIQMGQNYLKVTKKAKTFLYFAFAQVTISVSLNLYFVVYRDFGANGLVYTYTINSILMALLSLTFFIRHIRPTISTKVLRSTAAYSLPLVPHAMSSFVFLYSDRYILEKFISITILGFYVFADKISSILKLIVNQFNSAYSPIFNQMALKDQEESVKFSKKLSDVFIFLVALAALFATLFSKELIEILFGSGYQDAWVYVGPLACGAIFRSMYCFASAGIFFEKQTQTITFISIFAGCLNLALNIALIPTFGVWAAIGSTVLSYAAVYVLAYYKAGEFRDIQSNGVNFLAASAILAIAVAQLVVINMHAEWLQANMHLWLACRVLILLVFTMLFGWRLRGKFSLKLAR